MSSYDVDFPALCARSSLSEGCALPFAEFLGRYLVPQHFLTAAEAKHLSAYPGNRYVQQPRRSSALSNISLSVQSEFKTVGRCTLLCSWYERRLRQINGPRGRGGGDAEVWSERIFADRRKTVERLILHVLEVKCLFASTNMVAQVLFAKMLENNKKRQFLETL